MTRQSWRTLAILVLCAILSYTDRQVLTLLVDELRGDLGIGDTQVSLLLGGLFAATYGVAGVAMGMIADRANRRVLIIVSVAGWSVATILCGLATSFGSILLARLMVAAWEAALTPAALSLISDCFSRGTRGRAISIYIAAIPLGGGLSIVISGLMIRMVASGFISIGPLAHLPSWRVVLLAFGTLGFGVCALATLISEPPRVDGSKMLPSLTTGANAAADAVKIIKTLWPILAAMALLSLATNATAAWLPSVLIRQFRYAPSNAGVPLGLTVAAFGVGGVLAGGWLGDRAATRSGEDGRLRLCLAATLLALPFSVYGAMPSGAAVIAGAGFFLFFTDIVTSAGLSSVVALAHNRMRGTAVSVSFLLNVGLGAGIGAPAVAIVFNDALPSGTPMGIALAIVVSCAVIGAAAALLGRGALSRRARRTTI